MTTTVNNVACNLVIRDFRVACAVRCEIANIFLEASSLLHSLPISTSYKWTLLPPAWMLFVSCNQDIMGSGISLAHEESPSPVGLRRKGQGIQSLHDFVRGSDASALPSEDERFFSHALRNDEIKCGT